MDKYVCPCGSVYDPAVGDPEHGIAPGTPWEAVPRVGSAPCAVWARTFLRRNKVHSRSGDHERGPRSFYIPKKFDDTKLSIALNHSFGKGSTAKETPP